MSVDVAWERCLDTLEERVRAQEEAMSHFGRIPSGDLPKVDGPLPSYLALRALSLLERSRALETQAAEQLHKLRVVRHPA